MASTLPLESVGRLILAHRDRARGATERWVITSRPTDSSGNVEAIECYLRRSDNAARVRRTTGNSPP